MRRNHGRFQLLRIAQKETAEMIAADSPRGVADHEFDGEQRNAEIGHPFQQHRQVGFVVGSGVGDEVAEVLRRAVTVADKQIAGIGIFPAVQPREPARRAEVVERHHGSDAGFMAGGQHAPVVFQLGARKSAALRFDARPLDGEAIGIEAERGQKPDVFGEAMVVVAGVHRGFDEQGGLDMFHDPQVAVDVVALDLVRSSGRAPQKSLGKIGRLAVLVRHHAACNLVLSIPRNAGFTVRYIKIPRGNAIQHHPATA